MSDGIKVAKALVRMIDGLVSMAGKRSEIALVALCEAMELSPLPMRIHLAHRLLDLEICKGVEIPLQWREMVGRTVEGKPPLDILEMFEVIEGGGEATEDKPPPRLRVVKENKS